MERRRGARIPADVWIEIRGVDSEPVLRRGDISVSGLYVEVDQAVGEAGSVQQLRLIPRDQQVAVDVLARVVRVVHIEDIWRGSGVAGIAFEFLPDTNEKRHDLAQLVRRVLATQTYVVDSLQAQLDARIDLATQAVDARVVGFGVRGMLLDTAWPAEVGETIACQLHAPEHNFDAALEGTVVRATEAVTDTGETVYHVEVAFPGYGGDGVSSMSATVDSLLEEVVLDGPERGERSRDHLKGALSRIPLSSLLAFFELERMTGELTLEWEEERARVYINEGRVIDVVCDGISDTPRALLASLLQWDDGIFEFAIVDVNRAARLTGSTSGLLLDLARESDESER